MVETQPCSSCLKSSPVLVFSASHQLAVGKRGCFKAFCSPPWSDMGLRRNLSHSLALQKVFCPHVRRTLNYHAGAGGDAGIEGIKTRAGQRMSK